MQDNQLPPIASVELADFYSQAKPRVKLHDVINVPVIVVCVSYEIANYQF